MSDNIRMARVGGRTIELCYESDLYWFWAWSDQINYYFYEDPNPPPPSDFLGESVFRPTMQARDAMMRFSVKYRHVIDQIQEFLDETEKKYAAFSDIQNDDTRHDLFTATEELQDRIESAVLEIYESELRNEIEKLTELAKQHPDSGADSADMKKIFPLGIPDDLTILALGVEIHEEQYKPKKKRRSNNKIAQEYADEKNLNADSLLRTLRRVQTGK